MLSKRWKTAAIMIAVLIILLCLSTLCWGDSVLNVFYFGNDAYPSEGTYYCESLNLYLQFVENEEYLSVGRTERMPMDIGYDQSFNVTLDGSPFFSARYIWNQISDRIYLSIVFWSEKLEKQIDCCFVRVD